MYVARTKPLLRAGSAIGFEIAGCTEDEGTAVIDIDLRGLYVHPDGRFRLRRVVKFYGGGVAEIWHVQGLFSSSTFAHGTVGGMDRAAPMPGAIQAGIALQGRLRRPGLRPLATARRPW
jgi:hypothetical protein